MRKNNKPSLIPVVIFLVSLGFLAISSQVDNFSMQTKLGFVGKCGLVIGTIGLWLFTLMPMFSNRKR